MKRFALLCILLVALILALAACAAKDEPKTGPVETTTAEVTEEMTTVPVSASIRILSQNLRCSDDPNGNAVKEREPRFKQLLEEYKPDLVGTQETTAEWGKYISKTLKEYGSVGCSREGKNSTGGEWNTVMYRLDRFELLDSDTFWLSSTPEKVSMVKSSKCKRICTWALLKDKETGLTLLFCNTHLDHGTDEVRQQQAGYLIEALKEYVGNYPMFLTGDFNALNTSLPYQKISEVFVDSHLTAKENVSAIDYTYHAYETAAREIDFVFYDPAYAVADKYHILNDQYNGFVSDHYGVLVDFTAQNLKAEK